MTKMDQQSRGISEFCAKIEDNMFSWEWLILKKTQKRIKNTEMIKRKLKFMFSIHISVKEVILIKNYLQ